MSNLESISIRVESTAPLSVSAENAIPVLNEIRHALDELQRTGNTTVIDLHAMPFGPGDRDHLFETLGSGEVTAVIDSLGETKIRETAYPGVWIVEYFSPNEAELTVHIEVTPIPSLLATPQEEINDSLQRLASLLDSDPQVAPEGELE